MKKLTFSIKRALTVTATLLMLSACSTKNATTSPQVSTLLNEAQLSTALQGTWRLEYIKNRPVIDNSPATLVFLATNKLSGQASCNSFFSSYQMSNKVNEAYLLTVSHAGATRKMCAPALMEQENRLLTTLPNIASYQITDNILVLLDENQQVLFKAVKSH